MSRWLPNPAWMSTHTISRLLRHSRHSFETGGPRSGRVSRSSNRRRRKASVLPKPVSCSALGRKKNKYWMRLKVGGPLCSPHCADGRLRTAQGRRRRRDLWTIYASDKASHESRPLRRSCRVRPVEEGRRGHGIPLRREWTAGPKQLQGGRVLHRECTAREGEPNTDTCAFHNGVLAISHTLIMHLHSLTACNIFSRQNTIGVIVKRVHWDHGETIQYNTSRGGAVYRKRLQNVVSKYRG